MSLEKSKYIYLHSKLDIRIFKDDEPKLYINGSEFIKQTDDTRTIETIASDKKRKAYQDFFKRQIKNLIILSGAGTSIGIGDKDKKGLSMSGLWIEAKKMLGANFEKVCTTVNHSTTNENLETLLSLIDGNIKYNTNEKELLTTSKEQLLRLIIEKCTLQAPSDAKDFPHARLIAKITQRKATLPRVKIFTLNYDLLFEQAANITGTIIIDGFSFTTPRTFSGRYFDYDIVQREKSRVKDEDNFISRLFHLYKLHGSLNWVRKDDKILIVDNAKDPLIVYPRDSKYENSYDQPFFEMMARFQQQLRKDNSILVAIGYSFNDKHINAAIEEALNQNPGFQLAIINPEFHGENTQFNKLIEQSIKSERIVLIDEKFDDFVTYFPEIQSYNDIDNEVINLGIHD